jgi:hypothetical protein
MNQKFKKFLFHPKGPMWYKREPNKLGTGNTNCSVRAEACVLRPGYYRIPLQCRNTRAGAERITDKLINHLLM